MTNSDEPRAARRARHAVIRTEVAQEEAEAAEAEAIENSTTLDVPLHLRIDRQLDAQLRQQAAAEHIPTSALVRRLLRQATRHRSDAPTTAEVEQIARRVAREEIHHC